LEDQKHLLPDELQGWWAELLQARRAARETSSTEVAENLRQRGLGYVAALYLSGQITVTVRDDLREALFTA